MTKLRILNNKLSAAVSSLSASSFLVKNGLETSDIEAATRLVEHTNSVIEELTSGRLQTMLKDLSTLVDTWQAQISQLPVVTPSTPSSETDFLGAIDKMGPSKMVAAHADLQARVKELSEMPGDQSDMTGGVLQKANETLSGLSFNVSIWSTLNCLKTLHEVDAPLQSSSLKLLRKNASEILGSFSEDAPCPEAYEQQLKRIIEGKVALARPSAEPESSAAKSTKDAKPCASGKVKGQSKAAKAKAKTKATKTTATDNFFGSDEEE